MKTKIILLISFLTFGEYIFAQKDDTTQVIEYDFVKGEYTKTPNPLLQNKPVVLKIKNINRLFYKPMVEGKDIESNDSNLYDIPNKTILNKLEEYTLIKPETLTLSFPYSQSLQENIKPQNETERKNATEDKSDLEKFKRDNVALEQSVANNAAIVNEHKSMITNQINSINALKEINKSLKRKIDSATIKGNLDVDFTTSRNSVIVGNNSKIDKFEEATKNLKSEIDSLVSKNLTDENTIIKNNIKYNQTIDDIKETNILIAQLNDNISLINSKYNSFYEVAIEVQKITTRYNNFIDKINRPDFNLEDYKSIKKNNFYNVESLEKTPIINPDNIKTYYSKISDFEKVYNDFAKECNDPKFRNLQQKLYTVKELQIYMQFIDKEFFRLKTSALDIYKNVDNSKISAKLNQVEVLDRELSQEENFTYTSDPIQGKGDILEFGVEINPKIEYKEALSIYQPRKFTYSSNLRGGVRFDFGVGLSIDFKNNNEEFEILEIFKDTTPQTSVKYLQMINDNKFLPKLVGMFHTSLRSNTNFSFGLSLGTALDVTNFDISSIYLGFSTLIGRKDKIALTIGPSFMSAKQLKNTYKQYIESNDLQVKLPDGFQLTNDIYTRNYKIGYFFSITYNLTTKQRSTFMSAKTQ